MEDPIIYYRQKSSLPNQRKAAKAVNGDSNSRFGSNWGTDSNSGYHPDSPNQDLEPDFNWGYESDIEILLGHEDQVEEMSSIYDEPSQHLYDCDDPQSPQETESELDGDDECMLKLRGGGGSRDNPTFQYPSPHELSDDNSDDESNKDSDGNSNDDAKNNFGGGTDESQDTDLKRDSDEHSDEPASDPSEKSLDEDWESLELICELDSESLFPDLQDVPEDEEALPEDEEDRPEDWSDYDSDPDWPDEVYPDQYSLWFSDDEPFTAAAEYNSDSDIELLLSLRESSEDRSWVLADLSLDEASVENCTAIGIMHWDLNNLPLFHLFPDVPEDEEALPDDFLTDDIECRPLYSDVLKRGLPAVGANIPTVLKFSMIPPTAFKTLPIPVGFQESDLSHNSTAEKIYDTSCDSYSQLDPRCLRENHGPRSSYFLIRNKNMPTTKRTFKNGMKHGEKMKRRPAVTGEAWSATSME